ncbi:hypothetical protein GCM10010121_063510 [Streptomyces brasiliensis]|uniref:SIP-like Rossmann fold domain-containing protein n=1 Tax=Streptomyces brasiliensis TaxID=1954 RepID=A0A917L5U2_9ACTN|nr:hypothetical protein GCM10010121_063510 [Streptomyces brasiliensis]
MDREATVPGTGCTHPSPAPTHVLAIGDPASLPAVNSLPTALGPAPATVRFEGTLDGLPRPTDPASHEIREVPRRDAGAHLVERVRAGLPAPLASSEHPYIWIACDTGTTRALSSYVRKELAVPGQRVQALGYWRAT